MPYHWIVQPHSISSVNCSFACTCHAMAHNKVRLIFVLNWLHRFHRVYCFSSLIFRLQAAIECIVSCARFFFCVCISVSCHNKTIYIMDNHKIKITIEAHFVDHDVCTRIRTQSYQSKRTIYMQWSVCVCAKKKPWLFFFGVWTQQHNTTTKNPTKSTESHLMYCMHKT